MASAPHPDPGPSRPRPQLAPSTLSVDVPPSLDTSSEFFQVLIAPYHPPVETPLPPRAQPRPDHVARCRATINWTSTVPTETTSPPSHGRASSQPVHPLDQPIYEPHGRWAWTHGLSLDNPKQLLPLRKGAQCSASIDSGTVAGKEIKYICRKWKMGKQKEWYGFYSELALYKSEQYLRPLQGDVVPHIIGVHVMPEAVSVTMEMPHSSFWMESSPSMPHALKEKVIAAFEKIHAQGVLHGDPELRHMLVGADGRVMIIDFGMSRAIREHPSVGIERAEPEEFRLEMRKVKYKLDYMGARSTEGDKVDDYLRRVRRNRKISELWKRRARGERVGPIPQYEEEPQEDELDPPVNAQDFQEDWMTASDDSPMRVVVPGQTAERVAREVQGFLWKLEGMCPACPLPAETPRISVRADVPLGRLPPLGQGGSHRTGENLPELCRTRTARRFRQRRHVPALGDRSHRCEDELFPLSAFHIEGASLRRDHIRHKHLKNTYISSLSSDPSAAGTFPSSIDAPEKPRGIRPEECRRIQELRRQAMVQYSRAPRGILKRRRDGDGDDGDPDDGAAETCKKLRFSEQVTTGRTRFRDGTSGRRRGAGVVCSRAHKRAGVRPECVDFTLPSLRTVSALVSSLVEAVLGSGSG